MSIDRNAFLESFAICTPGMNLIFLNHLGAPLKLLSDTSTIELLADKTGVNSFVAYSKSNPLVKELILQPEYRKTIAVIKLRDGSELNFSLINNIVRQTLLCLDIEAIKKSAIVNEFGMLVPAREYHYEYMILKSQFGKDPLSERYRNYFSNYEPGTRAITFKHIQTRFNLVFNTLEDLYTPKPTVLLAIIIGLRAEHGNSLLRMFLRSIELGIFNLFGWHTKKAVRLTLSAVPDSKLPIGMKKSSGGQAT